VGVQTRTSFCAAYSVIWPLAFDQTLMFICCRS